MRGKKVNRSDKIAKTMVMHVLARNAEGVRHKDILATLKNGDIPKKIKSRNTASKAIIKLHQEGLVYKDLDTKKYCLTDIGKKRFSIENIAKQVKSCQGFGMASLKELTTNTYVLWDFIMPTIESYENNQLPPEELIKKVRKTSKIRPESKERAIQELINADMYPNIPAVKESAIKHLQEIIIADSYAKVKDTADIIHLLQEIFTNRVHTHRLNLKSEDTERLSRFGYLTNSASESEVLEVLSKCVKKIVLVEILEPSKLLEEMIHQNDPAYLKDDICPHCSSNNIGTIDNEKVCKNCGLVICTHNLVDEKEPLLTKKGERTPKVGTDIKQLFKGIGNTP